MNIAKIFVLSLFVPNALSISIGSLRISCYRLLLLAVVLAGVSQLASGKARPSRTADRAMLAFGAWAVVALIANQEFGQAIESGGIFFAETIGAYYIGKQSLKSLRDAAELGRFLVACICALLLITIPEMFTGINFVWKVTSSFGGNSLYHIGDRFGLTRAFGPFDHPIICGIVSASAFGLAVALYGRRKPLRVIGVILAAFTSVSSGAVASIMTQTLVCSWLHFSRSWRRRWLPLGLLLLSAYILVDLLSNRSGLKVVISYLTFSPGTAQWRLLIWEFGLDNVWANPIFGLGFNDWVRPDWMRSGSMDNFWLVNAVRYGIPGFFFLATATLSLCRLNAMNRGTPYAEGWLVGAIGLIVSGCTVHFWNQAYVFLMFYLGFGAALIEASANSTNQLKSVNSPLK